MTIRKFLPLTTLVLLLTSCATVPDDPAGHFRIYRGDGTPISYETLVSEAREQEVVFLGEQHDDAVAHYLEARILESLADEERVLSLEMFETDVQYVLDEYLAGHISEDHLKCSGRAWTHYDTDYRPMIEFARAQDMPVIAANGPRRYVNMITRLGEESLLELGPTARSFLPPLPHGQASTAYADKFLALMDRSSMNANEEDVEGAETERDGPDPQKMLRAQSMWDASMAWSISDWLRKKPQSRILHVNGSFHTAERLGTVEHLLAYRPDTRVLVVTMIPSSGYPAFAVDTMAGQGDFVIVTDPAYQSRSR